MGADAPNVAGLVYIAAFGLDQGESLGGLLSQGPVTPALANLFTDEQGFAWPSEDDFVNHLAADVDPVKAKVMHAVQQPLAATATVLTNSKGFTLYSFAPDTPTTSKCTGSCITYWPPVKGPATAGAGVTGKLATIKRSDGSVQATYNGHPLYTYVADTAPGQAKGNGLNLSGGVWHEVAASGAAAPAATTTAGSGGGY